MRAQCGVRSPAHHLPRSLRRGDDAPVLVAHSTPAFAATHLKDPQAALPELEVDRGPYVEGILQLRERHDVIMTGFRHELDIAWGAGPESVQDTRYYGTDALADHADEMELVGEDELEVRLATDHFADAIAREWKPELLALNGYLSWIDSSLRVDAANGPHSPQRVALAMYGAFAASRLGEKFVRSRSTVASVSL